MSHQSPDPAFREHDETDAPTFSAAPARGRFVWTPRAGWLSAGAAGVALALGLSLAPVRTTAENFLAVFEPHSFAPIALTKADVESLRGFPQLGAFGYERATGVRSQRPATFSNILDAMRAAHQVVLHPRYLPAGVSAQPSYVVLPAESGAFTFSAARTREVAEAGHTQLPPMPANLDGSTLYASFAPTVITSYGPGLENFRGRSRSVAGPQAGAFGSFGLFQAPAPRVYSTGASVRDIVDYLLKQPGISPSLAAQIRAIGDPSTTLPIPIPLDKALAQTVWVSGVPALVIGDETGVGSVVVWERAGMVYGVAGPLRESELLMVANSLTQ